MSERRRRRGAGERGVTDLVGYVLVFSLVVSIVGVVTVSGFASLSDVRDVEQTNNAERAFDVFSDNMADIYEHGAPSRATEMSLTDASLRTTSSITVNISANDTSSTDNFTLSKHSRPIIWEGRSGTEVVYSLGATIRDQPDGGLVVDAPPFQLDPERTVLPVVQVRDRKGQSFGESTVRIRAVHGSSNVFLTDKSPEYDVAWLNITTPRAHIWEDHLDRYPDTTCWVETKASGETVVCDISNRDELHVTLARVSLDVEG